MFFQPKTVACQDVTTTMSSVYSDMHKEAFGCRPGIHQIEKVRAMSPVEMAAEEGRIVEWMDEGERINELRTEVARFDFSRTIEYFKRREGLSDLEAFENAVTRCCNADHHGSNGYTFSELAADWDYACYLLNLPYSDAKLLKAEHERLQG